MKNNGVCRVAIFLTIFFFLTGCKTEDNPVERITPEQALTEIAQTLESEWETANPPEPTNTMPLDPSSTTTQTLTRTISPTASKTPIPTPHRINPPESTDCDDAYFVRDITIPDGYELSPGEVFTKTWRVQNNGTCTWTSSYSAVFIFGSVLGSALVIPVPIETVVPGMEVDITVEMIAPITTGQYSGYWRMQNADRLPFGDFFYVDILVSAPTQTQDPILDETLTPTDNEITPTPT
jgi:hypothetical protein